MKRTTLLFAAYAFDLLAGDPEWLPHPVRLIGAAIDRGEAALRSPDRSDAYDLVSGALLAATVVSATYAGTSLLLRLARRISPAAGDAAELLLAWTTLAGRNLYDEAVVVVRALDAEDLPQARTRLARIVGRDTAALDAAQIARAVIETVAESLSDGIVAPTVYLALGGVPLAMAYKAVNTLDSMIGHADERYFYFGKFAARLDDAANLLPARLSAVAIIAASGASSSAFRTWRRDRCKHRSPNAGHPESAMAGALQVRLGGQNHYGGEAIDAPVLGAAFEPASSADARRALQIAAGATLIAATVCALIAAARTGKRR